MMALLSSCRCFVVYHQHTPFPLLCRSFSFSETSGIQMNLFLFLAEFGVAAEVLLLPYHGVRVRASLTSVCTVLSSECVSLLMSLCASSLCTSTSSFLLGYYLVLHCIYVLHVCHHLLLHFPHHSHLFGLSHSRALRIHLAYIQTLAHHI